MDLFAVRVPASLLLSPDDTEARDWIAKMDCQTFCVENLTTESTLD
jgi:hypothetical protein